jgi:hypothetical protein
MRPLSQILLEFTQPLLGDKPDEGRFRAVMDQVVLLWNLALLPPTEQDLYWKQIWKMDRNETALSGVSVACPQDKSALYF